MSVSVDVIICTRNDDTHGLIQTLSSVCCSNEVQPRIILVNDSRQPLPSDIIRFIDKCDFEFVVISTTEQSGLTAALKVAETKITSNFIARADVGDLYHPDKLKKQVELMKRNENCALIATQSKLEYYDFDRKLINEKFTSSNYKENDLYLKNVFVHGSILMRTSIFKIIGGYNTDFKLAQDYEIYRRILNYGGEIKYISENLYTKVFRYGKSNTLLKNRRSSLYGLLVKLKYFKYSRKLFIVQIIGIFYSLGQIIIAHKLKQKIKEMLYE